MCKKIVFEEKILICFYLIKNDFFFLYNRKTRSVFLRDKKKMVLSFVKDQIYFDDDKKRFFI